MKECALNNAYQMRIIIEPLHCTPTPRLELRSSGGRAKKLAYTDARCLLVDFHVTPLRSTGSVVPAVSMSNVPARFVYLIVNTCLHVFQNFWSSFHC